MIIDDQNTVVKQDDAGDFILEDVCSRNRVLVTKELLAEWISLLEAQRRKGQILDDLFGY